MQAMLSKAVLERENTEFHGTGGRSEENASLGFRPAFLDMETHTVYAARFADGRPAPFHVLDGLPDAVVVARYPSGNVSRVKASVVSGFVRDHRFYTREEASRFVAAVDSAATRKPGSATG